MPIPAAAGPHGQMAIMKADRQPAVLRSLVSAIALFLLAVNTSGTFPGGLEPATPEGASNAEQLPPPALRLLNDSDPCDVEVTTCEAIQVAFIHVYKSAGSAYRKHLISFCGGLGHAAEILRGYDRASWTNGQSRGSPCDLELLCGTPGWTCYAVVRDPLPRFLSAFHETMMRRHDWVIRQTVPALDANATGEMKRETFERVLKLREANRTVDAHLRSQAAFLPRLAPVAIFRVEDGPESINNFLRARYKETLAAGLFTPSNSSAPAECPHPSLSQVRSRTDPRLHHPQYTIEVDDLTRDQKRRITRLFAEDYCRLRYSVPEGLEGTFNC